MCINCIIRGYLRGLTAQQRYQEEQDRKWDLAITFEAVKTLGTIFQKLKQLPNGLLPGEFNVYSTSVFGENECYIITYKGSILGVGLDSLEEVSNTLRKYPDLMTLTQEEFYSKYTRYTNPDYSKMTQSPYTEYNKNIDSRTQFNYTGNWKDIPDINTGISYNEYCKMREL